MRKFRFLATTALVFGIGAAPTSTQAQAPVAAPQAPAAAPNFTGQWRAGGFEPPPNGRGGVKQHPGFQQRGSRENGRRVAPVPAIADLNDNLLKPWAAARLKETVDKRIAGEIILPARSLCWPNGVPGVIGFGGQIQLLQTQDQVTIHYEEGPEMRRIYLNRPHSQNLAPSWYGESVGHYEGDTLVVDTNGFNDKTVVDDFQTPHSEKMRVIERYRLIDNGNTLQVIFTVEDPETFNEAWSGMVRYQRPEPGTKFVEIRCAENNFDVLTGKEYPLPKATKLDF